MTVSVHQPSYWPWLGLIDKINKSHLHIILDNVAMNKASFQHRNALLVNGKRKYITIPTDYSMGGKINNIKITNKNFTQQHFEKISNYYKKSPFYSEVINDIMYLYNCNYEKLIDVVLQTMFFTFSKLNIKKKIVLASELNIQSKKADLVLDLCTAVNAKVYLSGIGAKEYMNKENIIKFAHNKIKIIYQYFNHPIYNQFNSTSFISGLSILDAFFNLGYKHTEMLFKRI